MTAGKREPVAEIGAEDYRIVRHTHDVQLATKLMTVALVKEFDDAGPLDEIAVNPGHPHPVWMRVVPALPGSAAAFEGWAFQYLEVDGPSRGAFRAVVFKS